MPEPGLAIPVLEAEIMLSMALSPNDTLPVIPGAVVSLDYNTLTATARFQGESPFANCAPATQSLLIDTLSGLLNGFPAANISTACAAEGGGSSGGSTQRRRVLQDNSTCDSAVKNDITFKVDPATPMDTFRSAVFFALSDGGLPGICPLGALMGDWATTGASVRAMAAASGAFADCRELTAAVLSAVQSSPSTSTASVANCQLVSYYGALPTAAASPPPGGDDDDDDGAAFPFWIIAVILGALLLLGLLIFAAIYYRRKRKRWFDVMAPAVPAKADEATPAAGGAAGATPGAATIASGPSQLWAQTVPVPGEGGGAVSWASPSAAEPGVGGDGTNFTSLDDAPAGGVPGPGIPPPGLMGPGTGGIALFRKTHLPAGSSKAASLIAPPSPGGDPNGGTAAGNGDAGIDGAGVVAAGGAAPGAGASKPPPLPPLRAGKLPELDPALAQHQLGPKPVLPSVKSRGGGDMDVAAAGAAGTGTGGAAGGAGGTAAGAHAADPLAALPAVAGRRSALPSLAAPGSGGVANPFAKPVLPALAHREGFEGPGGAAAAAGGGAAAAGPTAIPGILPTASLNDARLADELPTADASGAGAMEDAPGGQRRGSTTGLFVRGEGGSIYASLKVPTLGDYNADSAELVKVAAGGAGFLAGTVAGAAVAGAAAPSPGARGGGLDAAGGATAGTGAAAGSPPPPKGFFSRLKNVFGGGAGGGGGGAGASASAASAPAEHTRPSLSGQELPTMAQLDAEVAAAAAAAAAGAASGVVRKGSRASAASGGSGPPSASGSAATGGVGLELAAASPGAGVGTSPPEGPRTGAKLWQQSGSEPGEGGAGAGGGGHGAGAGASPHGNRTVRFNRPGDAMSGGFGGEGGAAGAGAAATGAAAAARGGNRTVRFNRPGDGGGGGLDGDDDDAMAAAAAAKVGGPGGGARTVRQFHRPDGKDTSGMEADAPPADLPAEEAGGRTGLPPNLRDFQRPGMGAHGGGLDSEAAAAAAAASGGAAAGAAAPAKQQRQLKFADGTAGDLPTEEQEGGPPGEGAGDAAAAAAGLAGTHSLRQFKFAARMRMSMPRGEELEEDRLEDPSGRPPGRYELPEGATEEERRLHAMQHAEAGPTYGDEKIGPVDQIQLQREMRRRALLEQMKNSAWTGSFKPQGPGDEPGGGGPAGSSSQT